MLKFIKIISFLYNLPKTIILVYYKQHYDFQNITEILEFAIIILISINFMYLSQDCVY
jgi:hypothetical protein